MKYLLGFPFYFKPGKRFAVSAFCRSRQHLNFPQKPPGNYGYCWRKTPGIKSVKSLAQVLKLCLKVVVELASNVQFFTT